MLINEAGLVRAIKYAYKHGGYTVVTEPDTIHIYTMAWYIRSDRARLPRKATLPRFGGSKYGPDNNEETRTKSGKPYIAKPRRNKRDVWTVSTSGFRGAHFAVFPEKLIEPCILAGCPEGGTVLDPFAGSGTTGAVCKRLGRNFVGVEINPEYEQMARERIAAAPAFAVQLSLAEA